MAKYDEEMAHAMKIYRYLHDQGARVELEAVDKPPCDYAGVLDMFEKTLAHEQEVTASFNGLVDAALSEKEPRHQHLSAMVRYGADRGRGDRERYHRPVEAGWRAGRGLSISITSSRELRSSSPKPRLPGRNRRCPIRSSG